jgi:hypothetical protein
VQIIQADNGAEFQSAFQYHVLDKGVGHRYIKPRTPDLTAKWSDPTASTPKGSTPYSTAWSSTTPRSSTTNSKNGRITTTTTGHTAASPARHPTNDYAK